MRSVSRGLGIVLLLLAAACATRAEVEEIVLSSNAAMVGPWVERPGNNQEAGWEAAVDRIERLIAAHPEQTVLTNHLRVRQAMLLTVNGQAALAREIWGRVDAGELKGNARDRALYGVRSELVWAYSMLPPVSLLNAEEREFAARAVETLSTQEGPEETRDYFRIIAAEIAVKRANSMPQATEADLDLIGQTLTEDVKEFIRTSPNAAVRWADGTREEKDASLAGARALSSMRARVWFDQVVELYRREAAALGRPLALEWTLTVTVFRDGNPVQNAIVTIASPRHASHATKTDGSGTAVITSRFPGSIDVQARDGDVLSAIAMEVEHGGSTALTIDLGE